MSRLDLVRYQRRRADALGLRVIEGGQSAPSCTCIITRHERQEQASYPQHGAEIRRRKGAER